MQKPHYTEGLANTRKTLGHLVTFQLCGRCVQCADSTPGRVPLKQWWKLTFLFLSSNNMAFKMLLTPHNSLMVPFTQVSEAVHPNSDPSDSPAADTQGRRASRMDENVNIRLALTGGRVLWSRVASPSCKPPHFHIHPSLLPLADSWIHTNTKHRMWFGWEIAKSKFGPFILSRQWNIFMRLCYKQRCIWIKTSEKKLLEYQRKLMLYLWKFSNSECRLTSCLK